MDVNLRKDLKNVLKCASRISCGEYHTLVVTERLELYAWGGNSYGQVGNGNTKDVHKAHLVKEGITACAAGRCHSLAVTTAGEVYAWGNNEDCLLGTGFKEKQEQPTKIINSGVKAVAAGWRHCLALTERGEVFAWGGNEYGQLGDGTRTSRRSPVMIMSGGIKSISCGWYHNLALTDSGDVLQWGFTSQDPSSGHMRSGKEMIICGGVAAIAAGGGHSLALTEDGNVLAWGSNDHGQLGDGSTSRRIAPVTIATNCAFVAAGSYHSLAVDENNNLVEWGFHKDRHGKRENKWKNAMEPTPVNLDDQNVFACTAGGVHSLAVTTYGEVFTWGSNSYGQLGDGTARDRDGPAVALQKGTMETIPESEIIAKLMKGPAETAGYDALAENPHAKRLAEKRARMLEERKALLASPQHSSVPELLHKVVGNTVPASLGATYPLSFNGCTGMARSSLSTGNLGFVPATGFRPDSKGNTIQALQWPDGPGTLYRSQTGGMLPRRRRPSLVQYGTTAVMNKTLSLMDMNRANGPRTDPGALRALTNSGSLPALPMAAATDGFRHRNSSSQSLACIPSSP